MVKTTQGEVALLGATFVDLDGYPSLKLVFSNGMIAMIDQEAARDKERGHGVFLGMEWRDLVPAFKSADGNTTIRGHTRDPDVVKIVDVYLEAINGDDVEFVAGKTIYGQAT